MNILIILLVSAFIHASWNAFLKNRGNTLNKGILLSSFISVIVFPFLFFVDLPSFHLFLYLFLSLIAHTMYIHSLARAYRLSDFSIAYPFARGLAPLLTLLILVLIFGKSVGLFEIIGILVIVSSIFLLLDFSKVKFKLSQIASSLYFPLSITFYTIVDAMGVQTAVSVEQFVVWLFFLIPLPLLAFTLITDKKNLIRTFVDEKKSIFIASIGSLTSYSLVLWAYTQAPIHYVASIRESSIIFASLIGLLFFKEQGLKRRLAAAIILFIGVFLLEYVSH